MRNLAKPARDLVFGSWNGERSGGLLWNAVTSLLQGCRVVLPRMDLARFDNRGMMSLSVVLGWFL